MNRTDRLLAIVLELQQHTTCRAEDLAEKFETCKRTIYRDMQALSESGVPILAIPGQGYSLMEGYFLPPVHFAPEEAITLLLGSEYIEQHLDSPFNQHAASARDKIQAILPAKQKEKVIELQEMLRFLSDPMLPSHPKSEQITTTLTLLRESIQERRSVSFYYKSNKRQHAHMEAEKRQVYPYGLVNIAGIWYLIAHCLLRQSLRHFRLERMSQLQQEKETFEKPAAFSLPSYTPVDDRTLIIDVVFHPAVRERVLESRYFYLHTYEMKDDGFHVSLRARKEEDVLPWLLSWGRHVQVQSPASLAQKIKEEAKAMLHHFSSPY